MKKRVFAIIVALVLVAALSVALFGCNKPNKVDDGDGVTIATDVNIAADLNVGDLTGKSIKIGVVLIGDETEGYSEAHINGINAAKAAIQSAGGTVDVVWKKKIGEEAAECGTAIQELVSAGCSLIITNSYGHQYNTAPAAISNPDKTFIAMTGDYAAITTNNGQPITNFKNAFTKVYESRFVSGVVAGYKLKQLVEDQKLSDKNFNGDNIKLGYVGAFPFAEVVSGYTAFYLGVKSVVSNVEMTVKYTNSWSDFDGEYQTAKSLIAEGCVVIGQHADTEGAPTACEEAYMAGTRVYSVGYNVDMRTAAPHAALTSATNNWAVYYAYAISSKMKGVDIAVDWAKGFSDGAVSITAINGKVFTSDPSAEIKIIVDKLADGTKHVFDTSTFTVDGKKVTTYSVDLSSLDFATNPPTVRYAGATIEAIADGYFQESKYRSAPYFDLRINGIKEA